MPCPTSRSALRFSLHENRADAFTPFSSGRGSPGPRMPDGLPASVPRSHRGDFTASARQGSRLRPLACRSLASINGVVASFRPLFCLPEQPCHSAAWCSLPVRFGQLSLRLATPTPLRSLPSRGQASKLSCPLRRALPPLRLTLPAARWPLHYFVPPPFGWASRVRQPRVNELRCPIRKGSPFGTETKSNRQPCGDRGWPKKGKPP